MKPGGEVKAEALYQKLADRELSPVEAATLALRKSDLVPLLVEGMGQKKAEVKYGSAKALRIIADENPDLLYPHFATFAGMLEHANKIFQWEAIYVLAGLAGVDEDKKIDAILPAYFARIEGPNMITAANIAGGAAQIAAARPDLASRVSSQLLRAEKGRYESNECYEVVCGALLKSFSKMYKWVGDPNPIVAFAERHKSSSRNSTRRAAEALIAKHERLSRAKRQLATA
jgi:hypothetical protein